MKRFSHIDVLRAFGIVFVIIIHVFSDNLVSPLNTFIWNYLHSIIVAFVFCSGYVMYASYAQKLTNLSSLLGWYKKRLIRLLMPFYLYLLIHVSLVLLFPKYFSGLDIRLTPQFLFQSVTLIGGINSNWLPLLFLQLAVIFPILVWFFKKYRLVFWSYIILAFLITVGFTIWQFPYSHYRVVMWIPWSLFLVLPWYFYHKEQKQYKAKPYLLFSVLGAMVFTGLFLIWQHIGRSVTLIDNKYPPNFFYISYEVFGSFLILAIGEATFFKNKFVASAVQFLSRTSYNLFFIHFIVFDFILSTNRLLQLHLSVWYQVSFVFLMSISIAWGISWIQERYKLFLQAHNLFFTSPS